MLDHARRGQKWITEEFYKVLDVFGFRAVMFVEWGFRPADVKRTTERIKVPGAVAKEWVRTAKQEEDLAREAEAAGHRESAALECGILAHGFLRRRSRRRLAPVRSSSNHPPAKPGAFVL
ncbi:MAG: hypothetical protein IT531_07855 [Burkholderiales bacterium]|nr:hypothetical protein [Burkholderiales bacterium]